MTDPTSDTPLLASPCPLCDHAWSRHDPEDGECDAHAEAGFGPCPCGRDLPWMQERIAALSLRELEQEERGPDEV